MSDPTTPQPPPVNLPAALEVEAFRRNQRSDWFLEQFVALFNEINASVGITLTVGGVIITGQIVTPTTYFNEMAKQMEEALNRIGASNGSNALGDFIRSCGAGEPMSREERAATMDSALKEGVLPIEGGQRAYIHLMNASIYNPATNTRALEKATWRVRISAVDGFLLGEPNIRPK